ncbi:MULTISPECIES: hypothetical protein [Paenibacillus]|uniref:Uncharacterized protein n=2 Tax=Paenibacillus naphthalenovorans TaxID=162209 RepID=A0A0U2U319_9BACL|nr:MULTISPECIES: hypothetical protein [Paenibacillus]ALS20953.1 hypothetical protein IJ22_05660 [Paenibacillus naphthalenovorans]GCL70985.1 hypothetical protein PN4B1_08890 [Paenibacillus naphthalenovorans]SDI59618.1 hypothetical protein SAMN05421868_10858 [Paenibacillus naphthalenovorans]
MSFAIKVFLSSIELSAMIVLSLTMFRFQYYYYLHKIYGTAFIMSLITFYFRDIVELGTFAVISALSAEIILIMIIYRIPFFYSLLVSVTGFIAGVIIESAVMLSGIKLGLFDPVQIQQSVAVLGSIQLITAFIISLIIYPLQRRKIGFLFKTKYLASRTALKGYNFILSAFLVLSIVLAQLELISFYNHSMNIVSSTFIAFIFLIGIYVAYIHNKKIIRETYERPVRDELDRSLSNEHSKSNPK